MGPAVAATALGLLLTGCCGLSRQGQLEAVARDWCTTIRASQVIPVYPLTEDLQPGDVFLVQVPVDKQQAIYRKKGYLPLDNHLARIQPAGYGDFYHCSFLASTPGAKLPGDWIRPADGDEWKSAPSAAFPTYTFSVKRGAGVNLAIPVHGVPVGLSLLGSDSADGTISIEDARTLGLDTVSLYRELRSWALKNSDFLAHFGPNQDGKPRNYLRVVTRVYSTGKLSVLLNDARSFSGGADVGVPRPVDLVNAEAPTGAVDVRTKTLDNYRAGLSKLNSMIAESYQPSRASGSNDDLNPAETDEKTKKLNELRDARLKEAEEAAAKARGELDAAAAEAKPKTEEIGKAHEKLSGLQKERATTLDAGHSAELDTQIEAARAAIKALESDPSLVKLARASATFDFAKANLAPLGGMLPGGSLRVTAAASRSIALDQTLDPPLILGYLGFDVAIGSDGALGHPIPTHAVIDPDTYESDLTSTQVIETVFKDGIPTTVYDKLKASTSSKDAQDAVAALDTLANERLPQKFTRYRIDPQVDADLIEKVVDYGAVGSRNYPAYLQHRATVRDTIVNVKAALAKPSPTLKRNDTTIAVDSQTRVGFEQALVGWNSELDSAEAQEALQEASTRAMKTYVRLLFDDNKPPQ